MNNLKSNEAACPASALSAGSTFVAEWNSMAEYIHSWAKGKGFWEAGKDRNDGEMIALMHSELSEALESIRHGNPPDDKVRTSMARKPN